MIFIPLIFFGDERFKLKALRKPSPTQIPSQNNGATVMWQEISTPEIP